MKNVDQSEWKTLLESDENAVIIDSRTPKEWQEGVQKNALLLDVLQLMKFEQVARTLDKNKNYYVYCRSGQRSIKACALLEAAGVSQTYNLLGGMLEWGGMTVVPAL